MKLNELLVSWREKECRVLSIEEDKRKDVVIKLAIAWRLSAKRSFQQSEEESDQRTYSCAVVTCGRIKAAQASSLSCSKAGCSENENGTPRKIPCLTSGGGSLVFCLVD